MQKDALDLSLFSPDCQNLMNEMLSLIDAEKALNEGNLPADLNLLSQEMQDTLHDHRLLAPLELTFSAPEPYNLDVIRDLKNKELQDKLMQFHNKIQDLKRTPPPSDSIMSSVISFFTFPVTSLINFFQLPGESEEDLRYQFERLKTSAKTALTDDLEMLITKKQETFFANILAKHNTLSQDLYKARAEIDDYAKGVVTDIVTFHDAQVSAIAASNEQLIQIEQIIVDDLTELDTKMHQELALLNGQIQVLTPELHSDLLVIQDDEREKVVQIEKLINFFKEKINEEGKKPQLMTKRFHSIEALEGFEAHLRNAKRMPCHAIEAIKLHDAYENLLDEDDFPLDFEEEELGNVFRI